MLREHEIAREIIRQINYFDKCALLAWESKSFTVVQQSKENAGGLKFCVNGPVFRGWVYIELRWMDDYTLRFISEAGEEVKVFKNVYCDMLVGFIDWIKGN